jgi:hypothetical protein
MSVGAGGELRPTAGGMWAEAATGPEPLGP